MSYYGRYPKYKKKQKTSKDYIHLSYNEIKSRERYFQNLINLITDFLNKCKIYDEQLELWYKGYHKYTGPILDEFRAKKEQKELKEKIDYWYSGGDYQGFSGWMKSIFRDKQNTHDAISMHGMLSQQYDEQIKSYMKPFRDGYKKQNPMPNKVKLVLQETKDGKKVDVEYFSGDRKAGLEIKLDRYKTYIKPIQEAKEIIKKKHEAQQNQIQRAKDETAKHKAHSYAYQEKTRELAEEVKREIKSQLNKFKVCPYCEGDLGDVPHADHIYPVSKGGLSTKENMVYICQSCNSSKSDKTLNVFIKSKGLDRDKVEGNLELLEKDF